MGYFAELVFVLANKYSTATLARSYPLGCVRTVLLLCEYVDAKGSANSGTSSTIAYGSNGGS